MKVDAPADKDDCAHMVTMCRMESMTGQTIVVGFDRATFINCHPAARATQSPLIVVDGSPPTRGGYSGGDRLDARCTPLLPLEDQLARRTFFSFRYHSDVWRAWTVRNSWVVTDDREYRGFFDSSVFEAFKKKGDDSLKTFLRKGLENTSVTCVLAGTETWNRRWVRYEIARSVLKGNGLLTVYIHGSKNRDGLTAPKGPDPLAQMGVYKTDNGIFLAEWKGEKWVKYGDYTLAIPKGDLWFDAPTSNTVVQFSTHCLSYDFTAQDGRKNIGGWIETAAGLAGR
jgi:hypothetical protein